MEQAPGPRGSPHAPHGPAGASSARGDEALVLTAKVDNCLLRAVPSHDGHTGARSARVKCSKRWPHD